MCGTVDQNIADGRVFEEHFQGAEAERLVEHFVDEAFAFHAIEERVFRIAQAFDDEADFAAKRIARQVADARKIELVDQLAMNQPFEVFEALGTVAGQAVLGETASPAEARRAIGRVIGVETG